MTDKRVQINKVVKEQLPSYVRDDSPLVGEFLSAYYQGQEYQGGPIDIISNLDSYIELLKTPFHGIRGEFPGASKNATQLNNKGPF